MSTAEERGHFRSRFRTRSGAIVTANFNKTKQGEWKIFSIGGVDVPTALLPFSVLNLVYSDAFASLEQAKLAVKSA